MFVLHRRVNEKTNLDNHKSIQSGHTFYIYVNLSEPEWKSVTEALPAYLCAYVLDRGIRNFVVFFHSEPHM